MLYVVYFVSKFCPEKYDAFIFFHTISVIMNRLTLQPKGEGCLTTHQSHCNRLVFCKAHNESMYLSAAENKDKYSEARYAGKMDAYRDIFDMMKKLNKN